MPDEKKKIIKKLPVVRGIVLYKIVSMTRLLIGTKLTASWAH